MEQLDLATDFEVEKWIGTGKKYPSDPSKVDIQLYLYILSQLNIPSHILENLLPSEDLSVQEFLKENLPTLTQGIVTIKAARCFHSGPAHDEQTVERSLAKQDIPCQTWLAKMESVSYQAVMDGMQSIEDPRYPGVRLPLWSLAFWRRMIETKEIQQHWRKAKDWVSQRLHLSLEFQHRKLLYMAKAYLDSICWNELTTIPGSNSHTTSSFATFLTDNGQMSSGLINMMFSYLSDRAEADVPTDSLIIIENLRFMNEIEKGKKAQHWKIEPRGFLLRLEERILRQEVEALLFPVYMPDQKHWLTFRIDFQNEEVAYGDSLSHRGMKEPSAAIKLIQLWLENRIGTKYDNLGDALDHGIQSDGTSCGIFAANTAAHDVFDDFVWTEERKDIERLQWFTSLAKVHMTERNEDGSNPYPIALMSADEILAAAAPTRTSVSSILNPARNPRTIISHLVAQNDQALPPETISVADSLVEGVHIDDEKSRLLNAQDGSRSELPESLSLLMNVDKTFTCENEFSQQRDAGSSSWRAQSIQLDCAVSEGKKRKRSRVVSEVDSEEPIAKAPHIEEDDGHFSWVKASSGGKKKARSTIYARIQNKRYGSGQLVVGRKSAAEFEAKVKALDQRAIVDDPKTVRHFKCGKSLKMQCPWNIGNFKTHVASCTGPPKGSKTPGGGMLPLDFMFKQQSQAQSSTSAGSYNQKVQKSHGLPCPGLAGSEMRAIVEAYLERTGAHGGGAPSITLISNEMYGKPYGKLSQSRKRQVDLRQAAEHRWTNDHDNETIFSVQCIKRAHIISPPAKLKGRSKLEPQQTLPCSECQKILTIKAFKVAVAVPQPADKNYRYLNKRYHNKKLALLYGRSQGLREIFETGNADPLVVYAQGALSGKFKGNEMFANLLQGIVIKSNRESRGVGMQNFPYTADLVNFAHIIQSHSTKAYETLREFFPLPEVRTLQHKRAQQPLFPIGIQERSFELVAGHLRQLNYDGPSSLCCDDSQLLASFRPFYDRARKGYYLMGHVGEPLLLPDPESFRKIVEDNQLQKATKLRLWCLQVPIPKVPTIVVCAVAIPDTMAAPTLMTYLWKIIDGLLRHGVKVASYASDGSTVERSLQRLLEAKATSTKSIPITHGRPGQADYTVKLRFYHKNQPIATIQDPKHLLKTLKHNHASGARSLTLPHGPAHFGHLVDMVQSPDSPLFRRDVFKADRQDDNAATRLFSAASLDWYVKNRPEHLGLICYLFVFGELIDAYQNRSISLITRVNMVLRAHYFFEMWEKFLQAAKYPKSRHFLSSQCADIIRTLIHGFFQALYIYRDYSGDKCRPFVPWLLSTEVIEHVFGLCRQIVKDFTMLDFHHMIPKLMIALRQAALTAKFSDPRTRATGYNHTYTDVRGIDLQALSTYPSNQDINDGSKVAFSQAESLFAVMGVSVDVLYDPSTSGNQLPSIGSWFKDYFLDETVEEDDEELNARNADRESDEADYQAALDAIEETEEDLSPAREEVLQSYRFAAIALSIQDQITISSMPLPDNDDVEEALAEDANQISRILSNSQPPPISLPPLNINSTQPNPFDCYDPADFDLTALVQLRLQHQTEQAHKGVRTSTTSRTETSAVVDLTERQRLVKQFAQILREQGEKGVGAGLERKARYTGKAEGIPLTGNAANAAVVADAAAKRALTRRKDIVKKLDLLAGVGDAGINAVNQLRVCDKDSGATGYGIMFSPTVNKLVVCKILAMYSKTAGKGSRHNYSTELSVITAVSNMNVQVYEHFLGPQFRENFLNDGLSIRRFDFIPPTAFLISLRAAPTFAPQGIKLSQEDTLLFTSLKGALPTVMEFLKKIKPSRVVAEEVNDDD